MTPNLEFAGSRREKFSQTSRLQDLKLHVLISILTASQQNRSTGSRDIFIFVKIFLENAPSILATICTGVCAIKYCSSSSEWISVSTSQVLLFEHGRNLRLYKPKRQELQWFGDVAAPVLLAQEGVRSTPKHNNSGSNEEVIISIFFWTKNSNSLIARH